MSTPSDIYRNFDPSKTDFFSTLTATELTELFDGIEASTPATLLAKTKKINGYATCLIHRHEKDLDLNKVIFRFYGHQGNTLTDLGKIQHETAQIKAQLLAPEEVNFEDAITMRECLETLGTEDLVKAYEIAELFYNGENEKGEKLLTELSPETKVLYHKHFEIVQNKIAALMKTVDELNGIDDGYPSQVEIAAFFAELEAIKNFDS